MSEAQNNKPILHRKEWQTMMPALTATAAGGMVINDNANNHRFTFYHASGTVHYLYDHEQDDWIPIASGAILPAIASGACGVYTDWSTTITAIGGSTTTITVNVALFNINQFAVGKTVEFLSGTAANLGLRRMILSILHPNAATGTITLTLDSAVTSVANNDTFRISSGRFWIMASGTLVAASFRVYDIALGTWTSRSIGAGTFPAAPAGDARMWHPGMVGVAYETVADADIVSDTTIGKTTKAWTADQWINYQMRINGGTGIGQIRKITDSSTTTLTIASMNPDPDATSDFVIEGDEDAIYYIGNGAVAMYKYSISADTWSLLAPTAVRAAAPGLGCTADFVGVTGDAGWADVLNIKDGRYMFSARGGASAIIDRYDIAGGTNGAGTWVAIAYHPLITTFTTGNGSDWSGRYIYFGKEGSATVPQRFYRFDVVGNSMEPVTTDWYLGGVALVGNKVWVRSLSSAGLVKWLYCLQSTSTVLRRIMLF